MDSTEHTIDTVAVISTALSRCPGSHHLSRSAAVSLAASAGGKDGAAATWRPILSKPILSKPILSKPIPARARSSEVSHLQGWQSESELTIASCSC